MKIGLLFKCDAVDCKCFWNRVVATFEHDIALSVGQIIGAADSVSLSHSIRQYSKDTRLEVIDLLQSTCKSYIYINRYMNQSTQEKVFIESFSEYGDAIFRYCMFKVSNVELAEDMTQEVFTRYWQYLRDGKEMTNTRSFLYTIANNMAKDWYKKKKANSLDQQMEYGDIPRDKSSSPEVVAEYLEVLDTIDDMEQKDKEVLLLKHIEGLEPKAIAEILEETANTISVRINRATKRLQQKLGI